MSLTGKVALITGGASGIGASSVEEFLANNVKGVVVADVNDNEELIRRFNDEYGNGKVVFVKTDVGSKESFKNAFDEAIKNFKQIDILVNCAAIVNEAEWEKMIHTNLFGTTYGCLLAVNEYFPKYKSTSKAHVINVASVAGLVPVTVYPHYVMAKHGIVGYTRSLGLHNMITSSGNCIVALCPGATETPMLEKRFATLYREDSTEEVDVYAPQKPKEVAKSIVQLIGKAESGSVWLINEGVLSRVALPVWNSEKKNLSLS